MTTTAERPVALVTGGSRGLGHALVSELVRRGWHVVTDARDAQRLAAAASSWPGQVTAIAGDIADAGHRGALAASVRAHGRLDLLVNNASVLGPLVPLAVLPLSALRTVYEVNVVAPLSLVQLVDDLLAGGTIVNVTSDAAREPYGTWGGYGSAKAALDQLSAILAEERKDRQVYAFDPGDMATDLQQQAFPGEDVSDRRSPESVVPSMLRLVDERPPSGRYTVDALVTA
ncbi:SDR family oxidoreductase [Acidothermaceae bacterium B102]|nr:SDR family oxidoreductase [Acidothermaceae bacterium B102]